MSGLNARGFSLLELLVVVSIMVILGALAYPGYQRHLAGSRRVAAAACLLEHAQAMERHYAVNQGYQDAPAPPQCHTVAGFYQLSFADAPTAQTYVLQAVPQNAQAVHDAHCGTLSLNQWGERMVSVPDTEPMQCW